MKRLPIRHLFPAASVLVLLSLPAGCRPEVPTAAPHQHGAGSEVTETVAPQKWTCSMHPQIKLPKQGKCPICFMDLIPLETRREGGPRQVSVSPAAAELMRIETTPVTRRFVTTQVRMVGKVAFDETRVSHISAWVPGRIERLFVDYTGVPVRKGEHLFSLYSPELLGAQEELLQALRAAEQLAGSDVALMRETATQTVSAVRDKLRLWGLTTDQISAIERRGEADERITVYAPASGIVIGKDAQQGMYVQTGTRVYTIADLTRVWVNLEAYESDLAWLRYGQTIGFETEAYPGEQFQGAIAFIAPVLDEQTRTVKVRLNVPNENGRLKPGMFVRATVQAQLATKGRIRDAALAGKWISPMHPEVVKDGPGSCDVCGMPLVRAESLGYTGQAATDADRPLVIPATAALLTGKRAVVYVERDGSDPTFEGREILLGPRAGEDYVVLLGLVAGERVVTRGAFKLDAELQIRAKPSMMSMPSEEPTRPTGSVASTKPALPPAVATQIRALYDAYLAMQTSLAGDDMAASTSAAAAARESYAAVDASFLADEDRRMWEVDTRGLDELLVTAASGTDIAGLRELFATFTGQIEALTKHFGALGKPLYRAWCPMAFDNQGASWLQSDEQISNPYFGDMMLRCGEIRGAVE